MGKIWCKIKVNLIQYIAGAAIIGMVGYFGIKIVDSLDAIPIMKGQQEERHKHLCESINRIESKIDRYEVDLAAIKKNQTETQWRLNHVEYVIRKKAL